MRLIPCLMVVVCLLGAGAGACRREEARPNVLLVTIDTLRADHCSTYGYPAETTPTLTRLAKAGVMFRTAYAPSSTTAPSHAALLTGRHFRGLGVMKNGHVLGNEAVTIAEALAEIGYATAGFVSSFPVRDKFGFQQGFEVYDDDFEFLEEASIGRRKSRVAHDRLAENTNRRFFAWLDQRGDSRPLFAWVHYVDPHFPYRAPEPFAGKRPRGTTGTIKKYDAEVRYADRHLGQLIERFEKEGGAAGVLVIVTSDHGEGLGDHDWNSHGINLYEEAVRVPLVARWSGHLPEGKVVEEPVSLVDVAPSILALVGAKPLAQSDGHHLFATLDADRQIFLQRRDYKSDEVRGTHVSGEMTAVVHRGSKYITAPEEQRRELFDLGKDPGEIDNLLRGAAEAAPAGASIGGHSESKAAAPGAAAQAHAAPPPVPGDAASAAARYDADLERWRDATPIPENDTPLDKESLRALRSLGYVE